MAYSIWTNVLLGRILERCYQVLSALPDDETGYTRVKVAEGLKQVQEDDGKPSSKQVMVVLRYAITGRKVSISINAPPDLALDSARSTFFFADRSDLGWLRRSRSWEKEGRLNGSRLLCDDLCILIYALPFSP